MLDLIAVVTPASNPSRSRRQRRKSGSKGPSIDCPAITPSLDSLSEGRVANSAVESSRFVEDANHKKNPQHPTSILAK